MSTETIRTIREAAQDGHRDFYTAPELCSWMLLNVNRDSKDD